MPITAAGKSVIAPAALTSMVNAVKYPKRFIGSISEKNKTAKPNITATVFIKMAFPVVSRVLSRALRVCHEISVTYERSDLGQVFTIRKCKTGGIVEPISRILYLRIVQRWPEDEMLRCDTFFMTDT